MIISHAKEIISSFWELGVHFKVNTPSGPDEICGRTVRTLRYRADKLSHAFQTLFYRLDVG